MVSLLYLKALSNLAMWLERAERIRTQQRNSKNKLYALHAPEVWCISRGKARNPYEFGVKVSLVVTHKQGLMGGCALPIINQGPCKSFTPPQEGWLRRLQAVEPAIGHVQSDHRMDRRWRIGARGDALRTISCAAGYNQRWLMRAITRLGLGPAFLGLLQTILSLARLTSPLQVAQRRSWGYGATSVSREHGLLL